MLRRRSGANRRKRGSSSWTCRAPLPPGCPMRFARSTWPGATGTTSAPLGRWCQRSRFAARSPSWGASDRGGVDLGGVGPMVSTVAVCGYFTDLARLRREVDAYRAALPAVELEVILRPGCPDALSGDQLAMRLAAISDARTRFAFYNYGMARLDALARIKAAVSEEAVRDA